MKERFFVCCLVVLINTMGAGQQIPRHSGNGGLRADALVDDVSRQIKSLDEPALRVFLRLQVARLLWEGKTEDAHKAEMVATEALADIQEHQAEIPSLHLRSYQKDLLALLQLRAPDTAARLIKLYGLEEKGGGNQIETAYSMLDSKEGVKLAVQKVSAILQSGADAGPLLLFFLHRLSQEQPTELPRLLTEILAAEERKSASAAVKHLYLLVEFYVRNETPADIRTRFLNLIVKATRGSTASPDTEELSSAYNLLRITLPLIKTQQPSLYSLASAQMAAVAARVPHEIIDRMALDERISQSPDPLSQMINEAETSRDSSLKNDLLRDAANLALNKGKLRSAVDLVMRVESDWEYHVLWRNQFLDRVVDDALEKKDTDSADYSIIKIHSPLRRSSAIQKVAIYFIESKDMVSALERLNTAWKLIDSAENDSAKAVALLDIVPVFARVDGQRIPELAQSAIKVLNNIPGPNPEDKPGSDARENYIKTQIGLAYNIIPAFQSLARRDEIGALGLANALQRPGLKTAAIFGVSVGVSMADESTDSAMQLNRTDHQP